LDKIAADRAGGRRFAAMGRGADSDRGELGFLTSEESISAILSI
jgi:hypothetical protein